MRMSAPSKVYRGFPSFTLSLYAGLFVLAIPAARAQTNLQYEQPPKAMSISSMLCRPRGSNCLLRARRASVQC
jgi:hypothetical protein